MSKFEKFKKTALYSSILGAALAIVALIPALMPVIALLVLPLTSAPTVLLYMEKRKELEEKEYGELAISGAFIGAFSGLAFLIIFIPAVIILHLIFKKYFAYGLTNLNLFLICLLFSMTALLYACTNAVMGLAAGFLINYFDEKKS